MKKLVSEVSIRDTRKAQDAISDCRQIDSQLEQIASNVWESSKHFDEWDDEDIHSFGNLAMISQSFNSQQIDDSVTVKFARIMDQAHNHSLQSIKMYLMYLDAEKSPSGWKVDIKNSHQAKMFKILLESFANEN